MENDVIISNFLHIYGLRKQLLSYLIIFDFYQFFFFFISLRQIYGNIHLLRFSFIWDKIFVVSLRKLRTI